LFGSAEFHDSINTSLAFSNSFKSKSKEEIAYKTTLWAIRNRAEPDRKPAGGGG
jgi:hypothetical protein